MIYLVVSLVAGLIYVISGKVQFNKIVYLEGTKARIAGLIFLAPVALMLLLLGILIILNTAGINISDSDNNLIDTFASSLVRNGFMIGLAYIYFHSVSRETNERGGCLTYWLLYAAYIAILLIYFFLPNIRSGSGWVTLMAAVISILQIISITGIWFWKKWGVFAYAGLVLVSPVVAFLNTNSFMPLFISLIQSLSLLVVLYLLVRPKWQFFE